MDKAELVSITLDRLIDHFSFSPESFEYTTNVGHTVIWRPKIQLDSSIFGVPVQDPNNAHAIVVQWNPNFSEVTCFVFLTAPFEPQHNTHKCDSKISSKRWFEQYRGNFRKLMKLKQLIQARESNKANLTYLSKLSSVFPDAVDGHIK